MKDIIWSSVPSFKGTRQELIEKLTDYGYDADMLNLASDDVLTETINETLNNQRILCENTDESTLNDMIAQISDQTYNDIVIIDGQPKYSFDVFDSLSNTEITTDSDGTIYYGGSPVYVVTKDVIEKIIQENGLTDVNPEDVMIYGDYSEHELPTAKYFYNEELLIETMTEHPIKLQVEVNAIEDLANEYGLEYITKEGMIFTDTDGGPNVIESEYPEFARVVKSYFKSMGFFDNETGEDPEVINNYWRDLDINQFNVIISTCHKLIKAKANTEVDFEEEPAKEPLEVGFEGEPDAQVKESLTLNERLPKDAIKYFKNDSYLSFVTDIENSDGREISKEEAIELIKNGEMKKVWVLLGDNIVQLKSEASAKQKIDDASKIFELNIRSLRTPEHDVRIERRNDLHDKVKKNIDSSKYQQFIIPAGEDDTIELELIKLARSGSDEELGAYLVQNRKNALQSEIKDAELDMTYAHRRSTWGTVDADQDKAKVAEAKARIHELQDLIDELDNLSHEEMIKIAKGVRKEINDIYQIDSLTRLKRITRNNLKAKESVEESLNEDTASGPWSNPQWVSEDDFLTGESEKGAKKVDEELKNSLVEDTVSGPWSKPKWISEADFLTGED